MRQGVRSSTSGSQRIDYAKPERVQLSATRCQAGGGTRSLQQKFEENASILVQFRRENRGWRRPELIKVAEPEVDMELIIQKCGRVRLC